jgi:hypothetical protein
MFGFLFLNQKKVLKRKEMKVMKLKTTVLPLVFIFMFFLIPVGHSYIIDFDALTPGTVVTTIPTIPGVVTFSSTITGYSLVVSDIYNTTSGSNYLGVGDGGSAVFLPADVVTLTFANPITSLSVNFISSQYTPGQIFSIDAGILGSSISGTSWTQQLGDSGEVFPVSFSSLTPFSVAYLTGASSNTIYSYNIDDISFTPAVVVPIPSTMILFGSGLVTILFARRGRFTCRN